MLIKSSVDVNACEWARFCKILGYNKSDIYNTKDVFLFFFVNIKL